jgi:hypothetical protein
VGELQVGTSQATNRSIPFSDASAQDFNVFFSARNGMWTELLRLRKTAGHGSKAIRVFRGPTAENPEPPKEAIFEQIAEDCPRHNQRLVEWG